jgi:hypothetical protein
MGNTKDAAGKLKFNTAASFEILYLMLKSLV